MIVVLFNHVDLANDDTSNRHAVVNQFNAHKQCVVLQMNITKQQQQQQTTTTTTTTTTT